MPTPCGNLPDAGGGTPWSGWGNVQYPPATTTAVNTPTEPIYGQVWQDTVTDPAGQAGGWRAQVLVGPLGTQPLSQPACWQAYDATFNTQSGNNDEYRAQPVLPRPGLFGVFYRYQPPGGAWLYADLSGSTAGLQADQATVVHVTGAADPAPLVVVTLNLRCRLDDWPARLPLVVAALARVQPDVVAFQEDCLDDAGQSQSQQVRAALGAYAASGFALHHVVTHTATSGTLNWQEGISVMSTWPTTNARVLDLPVGVFPRKAWAVDVTVRGTLFRFYGTHLEFGTQNAAIRAQQAQAIAADFPAHGRVVVAGDFNATPDTAAVSSFIPPLVDAWATAMPTQAGATFPANAPTRRIDHILVASAMAAGMQGAMLLDEHQGSVWLSDHRGVAVMLVFP